MPNKPNTIQDKYAWLRWLVLVLIVLAGFFSIQSGALALLFYLLPTVFVFMHGSRYLGRKNIVLFFVIVILVTYATEYLGVHTGKIFGDYYYNSLNNGPLIAGVPPLVTLTYFSIAYGAYWLAQILAGKYGQIRGWAILGMSLLGGLIMSLSDLANDPVNSTINQVYIWTHSGIFFGVPYQNFVGWLGETFVLFIVVLLVLGYWRKAPRLKNIPSSRFQLEPVVLFAAPVLPVILRPIWTSQQPSIYEAMSLIALFGLGTLIVAAVLRILFLNRTSQATKNLA